MAVAFGNASTGTTASGGGVSASWSHDATGDDYLVVVLGFRSNPSSVAVTYNGTSMTLLGSQLTGGDGIEFAYMYGLSSPASGANTVSVTWTGTQRLAGCASSFNGVVSIGTFVSGDGGNSGGVLTTVTATSTDSIGASDLFVASMVADDYATNMTVTTGTERAEVQDPNAYVATNLASHISSPIEWTGKYGKIWVGVPLVASGGGGTPANNALAFGGGI